jgi:hypothetical protein
MPEIIYKRTNWGLPSPVKLENCHMTCVGATQQIKKVSMESVRLVILGVSGSILEHWVIYDNWICLGTLSLCVFSLFLLVQQSRWISSLSFAEKLVITGKLSRKASVFDWLPRYDQKCVKTSVEKKTLLYWGMVDLSMGIFFLLTVLFVCYMALNGLYYCTVCFYMTLSGLYNCTAVYTGPYNMSEIFITYVIWYFCRDHPGQDF